MPWNFEIAEMRCLFFDKNDYFVHVNGKVITFFASLLKRDQLSKDRICSSMCKLFRIRVNVWDRLFKTNDVVS